MRSPGSPDRLLSGCIHTASRRPLFYFNPDLIRDFSFIYISYVRPEAAFILQTGYVCLKRLERKLGVLMPKPDPAKRSGMKGNLL